MGDVETGRVGVWGGSESGKSTRIKEMTRDNNRMIVLDPMGDWQREAGFVNYTTLKGLYRGIKAQWHKGFKFVLTVDEQQYFLPDLLQQIASDLFKIQEPYFNQQDKRVLTLVVDEMADFYPNVTLKPEQMAFNKLCRKGRHYGVKIIGASQRIAEVHTSFRGNCKENYYFRQDEAVDIGRVLQSIGTQYKEKVQGLKPHAYILKKSGEITYGMNKCDWK